MTDEKIYYPSEITDDPLPDQTQESVFSSSQEGNNQVISQQFIQDQPLPIKHIAHETIGSSLNTKSKKILAAFTFSPSGALQIGEYENGLSGDIRISPNGIVARDLAGNITFALDGDTGDATFKGTILAGSLIADGIIEGGSININDKFIVDSLGNISIVNQDPTTLMDVLYDDLVIEMINLDLGKPGTGAGQLRAYSNGTEYAYLNADEGLVILSAAVTIGGTGAPAAPLSHQASLYVDQSGGKDRLMVRFNTGASQQVAIQP